MRVLVESTTWYVHHRQRTLVMISVRTKTLPECFVSAVSENMWRFDARNTFVVRHDLSGNGIKVESIWDTDVLYAFIAHGIPSRND